MRIFVTGATGFIGSLVVRDLLGAGHQVLGMTRSEAGAQALAAAGAEPCRGTLEDPESGTLEDPESLTRGAAQADGVIHCAFDHDFSNFVANCEKDRRAIRALGAALIGSDRPLVITSGTGIGSKILAAGTGAEQPEHFAVEDVFNADNPNPRVASEQAGQEMAAKGVKVVVVRLPQVHDTRRQGLVSPYVMIAREKGVAAYVGEGANRWPAAHVTDVARLYRLAIEQGRAGERFHAVAEEGVPARDIAAVVGRGLGVPVVSLRPEQAMEHFGWLGMFIGVDLPSSSAWTRERLGWTPTGPGMIADLERMDYGVVPA